MLLKANNAISKELLIKGGYKIASEEVYLIRPIRRLRDQIQLVDISIKINDKAVNISANKEDLTKLAELKCENDYLLQMIKSIKDTKSYKIGRIITFLPRKIIKLIRGR